MYTRRRWALALANTRCVYAVSASFRAKIIDIALVLLLFSGSEIDEKKTKARRRRSDLRDRDDEMAAPLSTGLWDSTQAPTLQCLGASSLNRLHSSNGIKTYRHSNAYLTMTVQPSASLMARDVTSCHCLTSPLRNCAPSLLRSTSSPMHPSPSLEQTRCVCRSTHADRAGEFQTGEFQTGEFQTGEFQTEVNNLCLLEEVDCSEEADVLLQRVYCACPAHAPSVLREVLNRDTTRACANVRHLFNDHSVAPSLRHDHAESMHPADSRLINLNNYI